MASPTPVLPDVGSTIVPPGRSRPSCSAWVIIASAGRSLTLPPGLSISSLAAMVQLSPLGHAIQAEEWRVTDQIDQRIRDLGLGRAGHARRDGTHAAGASGAGQSTSTQRVPR
jgi:hypothetical protein